MRSNSRDPWRERCPEGHADIESRATGYRCRSCGLVYPGEPFDAAEWEFPVSEAVAGEGKETSVRPRTVLAAVVDICEPATRGMCKAREIDAEIDASTTVAAVREALLRLVERGLVARRKQSRAIGDWYRPTAAGRRAVRHARDDAGRFAGVVGDD